MSDTSFVRTEMLGEKPPPPSSTGLLGWLRENLFSSTANSILTVLCLAFIAYILSGLIPWTFQSVWGASSLAECRDVVAATWPGSSSHHHACWAVINERWYQLMFNVYPVDQVWRPLLAFALLIVALAPILFSEYVSPRLWIVTAAFPFLMPWLMWGGAVWGPLLVFLGVVIGVLVYRVLEPMYGQLLALPVAVLAAVAWWLFLIGPIGDAIDRLIAQPRLESTAAAQVEILESLPPQVEALKAEKKELDAQVRAAEALRAELFEAVTAAGDAGDAEASVAFLAQVAVTNAARDEANVLQREISGLEAELSAARVLKAQIEELPSLEASLPELQQAVLDAEAALPARLEGFGDRNELEAQDIETSQEELAQLQALWDAESRVLNAETQIERTYEVVGLVGLEPVSSRDFGGFTLSILIGVVAIGCSLPLGIVLALGRQSDLMIVKALCVGFIEFIRGVPLITLLFVASTLLNIFMPPGTNFDIILRVMIMATLFSAAYMAEVIRGGLAALPKGQYEGADSLGLNYWQAQQLIIMPQALKISIPGIVSTFIGMFKDTTLVSVIGLLDPLGVAQGVRSNPQWQGIYWELFAFIAVVFFIFCFGMSRYSMYLENKLKTDHR